MILLPRRGFLLGLGAIMAAPAIVRIENIMPVRAIVHSIVDPTHNHGISGPPLMAILPDGRIEHLTEINENIVAKIMASEFVYVR
jgi:hypothetical protein